MDEVETSNRVKMGLNFGPSSLGSLHSQLPLHCCLPDRSGCLVCQYQRVSLNSKQVLEGASFSHSCYTNIYVYCDINMLCLKTSKFTSHVSCAILSVFKTSFCLHLTKRFIFSWALELRRFVDRPGVDWTCSPTPKYHCKFMCNPMQVHGGLLSFFKNPSHCLIKHIHRSATIINVNFSTTLFEKLWSGSSSNNLITCSSWACYNKTSTSVKLHKPAKSLS